MFVTLEFENGDQEMLRVDDDATTAQFKDSLAEQLIVSRQKTKALQIRVLARGKLMRFSDELLVRDYALEGGFSHFNVFLKEPSIGCLSVVIDGVLYQLLFV